MVRHLLELQIPMPPSAQGWLHTECGSQGRELWVASVGGAGDGAHLMQADVYGTSS